MAVTLDEGPRLEQRLDLAQPFARPFAAQPAAREHHALAALTGGRIAEIDALAGREIGRGHHVHQPALPRRIDGQRRDRLAALAVGRQQDHLPGLFGDEDAIVRQERQRPGGDEIGDHRLAERLGTGRRLTGLRALPGRGGVARTGDQDHWQGGEQVQAHESLPFYRCSERTGPHDGCLFLCGGRRI